MAIAGYVASASAGSLLAPVAGSNNVRCNYCVPKPFCTTPKLETRGTVMLRGSVCHLVQYELSSVSLPVLETLMYSVFIGSWRG